MNDIDRLKSVFLAYVAATGLSEATVSTRFLGSGRRWQRLIDGSDIGSKSVYRALGEFAARWPEGHAAPAGLLPVSAPPTPEFPAPAGSDVSAPQGVETVTTVRPRDMPERFSVSPGVSSLDCPGAVQPCAVAGALSGGAE